MTHLFDTVEQATRSIRNVFPQTIDTAIVLGSGLSDLVLDGYELLAQVSYTEIQGLQKTTAPSHKGRLSFLTNGEITIALCAGRHHLYEGYSAQQVATLSYVMRALGANKLIVTNAAGALNPEYQPGEVMLIDDHINFTSANPLIGQDESLGGRFPDMSNAYSPGLSEKFKHAAAALGVAVHNGIYIGVSGPSLETSAERRMFAKMGADAIGMSTVLEVIAAKHAGLKVLGVSAITNLALGDQHQMPDRIEAVLENAAIAGEKISTILNSALKNSL